MKKVYSGVFFGLLLLLSSCSSILPLQSKADQWYISEGWGEWKDDASFLPGRILIECDLYEQEIRDNAVLNLSLLVDDLNRRSTEGLHKTDAYVDVRIREYAFMKNFRPMKTISLKITVLDNRNEPRGIYYFTEETKDSMFSSAYMYKEMEKGFKKLF